jgi:hypothetical protein
MLASIYTNQASQIWFVVVVSAVAQALGIGDADFDAHITNRTSRRARRMASLTRRHRKGDNA